MSTAIEHARAAQAEAADPRRSAFVSANAGSGKTHVLINRVTRLLMAGVAPQDILCVTYTKAAAAEMLNRLFERLGGYSIMDDASLGLALRELDPFIAIGKADLRRARALFALALETPGGLKIRTIHAFCESLLRRFPAEAGISPGFTVLDDRQGSELRRQSIAKIGQGALDNDTGPLADAIDHCATLGADALENLYAFAAKEGRALARLVHREGGIEGALALSAKHLGIASNASPHSEARAGWTRLDPAQLKRMANALGEGRATDKKCASAIIDSLEIADKHRAIECLGAGFLTQDGTPLKRLPTKAVQKNHPGLADDIAAIQATLDGINRSIHAAGILQNTRAALVLGTGYYQRFTQAKQALGALDFDDLVEKSVELVEHSEAADWVLYKLDYDLTHILVDEAQDNSDGQWQLIRRLSAEFFSGKGAHDETRTLFAVGDPKQSIYSFQGANPALFQSEAQRLLAQTRQGQGRFSMPALALSWRSCAHILSMVDETFAPFVTKALPPAVLETKFVGDMQHFQGSSDPSPGFAGYVRHQAQRQDAPGCVELWEPVPRPAHVPEEDPAAPVDAPAPQSSRNQLAAALASTIAHWLQQGDRISEKQNTPEGPQWRQRAIRPGDIMVLVRNRTGGLFEEIIRQLKLKRIAVAGADRMILGEQTAVLDLMSAARAALQDADDLALAEFLKGPFLQPANAKGPVLDDDALFFLASGRPAGQSLGAALRRCDDPRFAEARALMEDLRHLAGNTPPFAFFARLLYRPSHTGESYAKRLYARLGPEAEDPVREFLGKALASQIEQSPVLARFIAQTIHDETQIKREMEGAGNAVRVMTVHAAKGLEAPVVILPDTARGPGRVRDTGLMFAPDGALFWSPESKKDPKPCTAIRDRAAARGDDEHKRLLYVAMTRAQDRLVICGAKMGHGEGRMHEQSWYSHCHNAFDRLHGKEKVEDFQTRGGPSARRLGPAPRPLAEEQETPSDRHASHPDWVHRPLPAMARAPRRVAPSRWLGDDDDTTAVLSPLAKGGTRRYQRGLLIHTLLQALPDIAPNTRQNAARNFLQSRPDLDPKQREEIARVVFSVLEEPEFAALFGPDSRAELPISGTVDTDDEALVLAGQIDRLVVTKEDVLVVDFKTSRSAPQDAKNVSVVYLRQMAAYRALLRKLWPTRNIRCALLWTDGPRLMPVADSLLDQALQKAHTP